MVSESSASMLSAAIVIGPGLILVPPTMSSATTTIASVVVGIGWGTTMLSSAVGGCPVASAIVALLAPGLLHIVDESAPHWGVVNGALRLVPKSTSVGWRMVLLLLLLGSSCRWLGAVFGKVSWLVASVAGDRVGSLTLS